MGHRGVLNACIVFMWMTSDHEMFTSGAISVLKTSMRLSGKRKGEIPEMLAERTRCASLV